MRAVLPTGRGQLAQMPEGLRALAGGLRELKVLSARLAEVPAWVGDLTKLEDLTLGGDNKGAVANTELTALPVNLFQLGALKHLTLQTLAKLQEMPDASGLTLLESLTIEHCHKLTALPAGLFQLGALKQLTLRWLSGLQEVPDILGRMTPRERLTLSACHELRALPASIMHLTRLQHLEIDRCPLQDMPCIEALTALRNLDLRVNDYTPASRTFQALSRALPRSAAAPPRRAAPRLRRHLLL